MKILKIWFSEYPWDVRVEKMIDALQAGGHEVHLLCRNNFGQRRFEKDKFTIHRLPCYRAGKNTLTRLMNIPAFFNPFWVYHIARVVSSYNIDLILVRDLPLTIPALLVGRIFGKKVVFDMAECHPEIFRNYFKWGVRSLFMENPWVASVVEKITIKYIDHVFVMCEESKARLIRFGMEKEKVSVAGNTTRIIPHEKPKKKSAQLRIVYVGMIGEFRGLDTVIDAMPILVQKYKLDVCFDVVGNVGAYLDVLKLKVKRMNLEDRVIFHGWIDNKEIYSCTDNADIGVIPLWKKSHYDVTVSNKLFDYMACSTPVICSDISAMARIVEKENCGLIFKDRDNEGFISCVLALKDPKFRENLGKNGRKAVESTYNWENTSRKINIIAEQLLTTM